MALALLIAGCQPSDRDKTPDNVEAMALPFQSKPNSALAGANPGPNSSDPLATRASDLADDDPASQVRNYKHWRVVNPEPYNVAAHLSALCSAPPNVHFRDNPHMYRDEATAGSIQLNGSPIRVWVNPVAEEAMLNQVKPQFPVGSIIVKEKLIALPDAAGVNRGNRVREEPELLTVMIKGTAGFNPRAGDWEFLAFNGKATEIQARGHLENCQRCHVPRAVDDYVFRDYLPDDVRARLGLLPPDPQLPKWQ